MHPLSTVQPITQRLVQVYAVVEKIADVNAPLRVNCHHTLYIDSMQQPNGRVLLTHQLSKLRGCQRGNNWCIQSLHIYHISLKPLQGIIVNSLYLERYFNCITFFLNKNSIERKMTTGVFQNIFLSIWMVRMPVIQICF